MCRAPPRSCPVPLCRATAAGWRHAAHNTKVEEKTFGDPGAPPWGGRMVKHVNRIKAAKLSSFLHTFLLSFQRFLLSFSFFPSSLLPPLPLSPFRPSSPSPSFLSSFLSLLLDTRTHAFARARALSRTNTRAVGAGKRQNVSSNRPRPPKCDFCVCLCVSVSACAYVCVHAYASV